MVFCFGILALLLQISSSWGQEIGTGVSVERNVMDTCEGAAGPRPINGVFSPGSTNNATVDDVNGGFCGVDIDRPGIWWLVNGTGEVITTSSCHEQTDIKVKISVFTGSCGDLQCVTGGAEPDFECPILRRQNELREWDTMATSLTFPTKIGQAYYILVQQEGQYERGTVWLNFRSLAIPQNDNCVDAIGPVPRDMTRIMATSIDGTISKVPDYCGGTAVPSLYPGTWFQIMGTGKAVSVMSCGLFNFDGYAFSVYNGANCDSLECVKGKYKLNVEDNENCSFGTAEIKRPMTKFTFDTVDRSRYYIYVHFARTRAEKPTADFRFFVDDGKDGESGSSGGHGIQFEAIKTKIKTNDKSDKEDTDVGGSGSSGEKSVTKGSDGGTKISSSSVVLFHTSGISFFVLLVSWMIHS